MEVITRSAVMLMSAAAEKLGLSAEDPEDSPHRDLDEARRLITALAGLVTASAEYLGPHAGSGSRRAEDTAVGVPRIQRGTRRTRARPRREVHRSGLVASHTHFQVQANILAAYDRRDLQDPSDVSILVGARGGRLDGRHHRHAVSDRECLAGHPMAHQGASRVRQRLHLQLPRHQLRVGLRVGPAGGGAGGPQAHRLVDPDRLHGRCDRLERRRPHHQPKGGDGRHRRSGRARLPRRVDPVPGAGPQGVLGEGAPRRAGQGGRHAGRGHGGRHADRVGAARGLPRHASPARTGSGTRSTG